MFVVCWSSFVVGGSTFEKNVLSKWKWNQQEGLLWNDGWELPSFPSKIDIVGLFKQRESFVIGLLPPCHKWYNNPHPPPFHRVRFYPTTLFYACAPACASVSSTQSQFFQAETHRISIEHKNIKNIIYVTKQGWVIFIKDLELGLLCLISNFSEFNC